MASKKPTVKPTRAKTSVPKQDILLKKLLDVIEEKSVPKKLEEDLDDFITVGNLRTNNNGEREMGEIRIKKTDFFQSIYDDVHTLQSRYSDISSVLIDINPVLQQIRQLLPDIKESLDTIEMVQTKLEQHTIKLTENDAHINGINTQFNTDRTVLNNNTDSLHVLEKEIEEIKRMMPKPFIQRMKEKAELYSSLKTIFTTIALIMFFIWIIMNGIPALTQFIKLISGGGRIQ